MKRNLKKRKTWLRVLSVFFSFFIWLYVESSAEVEKDKVILLDYIVPDGFSLAEDYSKSLTVNVKGPRLLVRKYLQDQKKIEIPLNDKFKMGKNKYSYNLNRILPRPAFGLELLSLSPKNLQIKIEKTVFKKVPVIINLPAELKASVSLNSFKVTPRDIDISGPYSKMKTVKSIQTELLEDFDLTTSNEKLEVELLKPSNLIGVSATSALVSYTIDSSVSEFTFKRIPIIFQSNKLITAVDKRFVELTLKGVKKTLEKLNKEELKVIALVQESSQRIQVIELFINLPQGVELVSLMPNQVKITLE